MQWHKYMKVARSCLWTLGCVELAWYNRQFSSYLSSRILKVRYEDSISWILPLERAVPQGSILGPVLLTIYVDDLTNEINNSQIKMYVDDCQLLF